MAQLPREKFNETLQQFASSLAKAFPEEAKTIQDAFEKRVSIHAFVKNIQPHADSVRNQDSNLFADKFEIVDGLDLSRLWAKNMTDSARSAMWQYLQLLLLLGTLVTSTEDVLESEQMQEIIGKIKTASENKPGGPSAEDASTTQANSATDDNSSSQDNDSKPSVLEGLAHEIASDLPIPEGLIDSIQNCDNPMQLFGLVMKHQDCLPAIAQTICEKVQTKFESGKLNEQIIMAEMQPLLSKLSTLLGKDLDAESLSAMFKSAASGDNPMGNVFSMAQSMLGGLTSGENGGVDLPGLLKNLMAVAGNGGNGAGAMMNLFSSMMGSSDKEEELPDLADLEKKVRCEMRNNYRSQQAQNALPSRDSAKRAQLREKLEARRKAKQLPAP